MTICKINIQNMTLSIKQYKVSIIYSVHFNNNLNTKSVDF